MVHGPGRSLIERSLSSGPRRRGQPGHCWVVDLPQQPGTWPGVLVEWRLGDNGWQGRAVFVVSDGGDPIVIEAWVAAERLAPR